jgi:AcrR family transcriptional regulator
MTPPPRGPHAERTAATRRKLVDAARVLFEERGYAGTSTADIVRRAEVTRGALYHHFADKQDLLRAVVIEIQEELLDRVMAAALAEPEPWDLWIAGWLAFLDIADRPMVRVLMVDAPAVMGLDAWREIDDQYCLTAVIAGLRDLIDHGLIVDQPVEPLARVLLTAGNALATHIAGSSDPAAERATLIPVWLRQIEWIREPLELDR